MGNQVTSLGWVGAGRMGHALVSRLLSAGYDVAVYNRTRDEAHAAAHAPSDPSVGNRNRCHRKLTCER